MIGDTAGMIAPLCGDGMSMAMHSAMIAAEMASHYLNGHINANEFQQKYSKQWRKEYGPRLAIGRILQQVSQSKKLTSIAILTCTRIPKLSQKLVEITRGQSDNTGSRMAKSSVS
jgi:flavin-dependent dehydrogenase